MALVEALSGGVSGIGQERDPATPEACRLRDGGAEELRAHTLATNRRVHDHVLEESGAPSHRRAHDQLQNDHAQRVPITLGEEHLRPVGRDQQLHQSAPLRCGVGVELILLFEQDAEKVHKIAQIVLSGTPHQDVVLVVYRHRDQRRYP